eukprot:GFYU01024255.1.p2 GENE.GFYU01024255.1~~GFYU01024255.1.p2  ORF type:complete len:291 (+),score=48.62 GFYU01024255.1:78-875(+)
MESQNVVSFKETLEAFRTRYIARDSSDEESDADSMDMDEMVEWFQLPPIPPEPEHYLPPISLQRWRAGVYDESAPTALAAVTSAWNYLFSVRGGPEINRRRPVSLPEAMNILDVTPSELPVQGNQLAIRWFNKMCCHYDVVGKATYFWKMKGLGSTEKKSRTILKSIHDEINNRSVALVYHVGDSFFPILAVEEGHTLSDIEYIEDNSFPQTSQESGLTFLVKDTRDFELRRIKCYLPSRNCDVLQATTCILKFEKWTSGGGAGR